MGVGGSQACSNTIGAYSGTVYIGLMCIGVATRQGPTSVRSLDVIRCHGHLRSCPQKLSVRCTCDVRTSFYLVAESIMSNLKSVKDPAWARRIWNGRGADERAVFVVGGGFSHAGRSEHGRGYLGLCPGCTVVLFSCWEGYFLFVSWLTQRYLCVMVH